MKKLIEEYHQTKQPGDDFLAWLLIRKLGFWGKIMLAVLLWSFWFKFCFDLRFMVFFLEFIFVGSLLYGLGYLILRLRKKRSKRL